MTPRPEIRSVVGDPPHRDAPAWEIHGTEQDGDDAMRAARAAKLSAPARLMLPIQVNIRASRLPPAENDGVRYMAAPVKLKDETAAPAVLGPAS